MNFLEENSISKLRSDLNNLKLEYFNELEKQSLSIYNVSCHCNNIRELIDKNQEIYKLITGHVDKVHQMAVKFMDMQGQMWNHISVDHKLKTKRLNLSLKVRDADTDDDNLKPLATNEGNNISLFFKTKVFSYTSSTDTVKSSYIHHKSMLLTLSTIWLIKSYLKNIENNMCTLMMQIVIGWR